jgi:threonine/homoserine/homoserine lactone efflux protein
MAGANGTFGLMMLLLAAGLSSLEPGESFLSVVKVIGGAFLVFLAVDAIRENRRRATGEAPRAGLHPTVRGILAVLLNPGVYVFLATTGTAVAASAADAGGRSLALLTALAMLLGVSAMDSAMVLLGAGAHHVSDRALRILGDVLAVAMGALGVWLVCRPSDRRRSGVRAPGAGRTRTSRRRSRAPRLEHEPAAAMCPNEAAEEADQIVHAYRSGSASSTADDAVRPDSARSALVPRAEQVRTSEDRAPARRSPRGESGDVHQRAYRPSRTVNRSRRGSRKSSSSSRRSAGARPRPWSRGPVEQVPPHVRVRLREGLERADRAGLGRSRQTSLTLQTANASGVHPRPRGRRTTGRRPIVVAVQAPGEPASSSSSIPGRRLTVVNQRGRERGIALEERTRPLGSQPRTKPERSASITSRYEAARTCSARRSRLEAGHGHGLAPLADIVELGAHERGVDPASSVRRLHADTRDAGHSHRAARDRHREGHRRGPGHELVAVEGGVAPVELGDRALALDLGGPVAVAEGGLHRLREGLELVLHDRADLDVHDAQPTRRGALRTGREG